MCIRDRPQAPQGPFLPRIPRPPQPLATGNTRRSSPHAHRRKPSASKPRTHHSRRPAAVRSSSRPRRQAAPAPAIRESSPIVECHRGTAFPKLVSFNFLILCFPEPPAPTRLAADHLMHPHLQKESLYPPGGVLFCHAGRRLWHLWHFIRGFALLHSKKFFYAELGLQMP